MTGMTEAESEALVDVECALDPLRPCPIRARRGWYIKFQATKQNYGPPKEDVWYRREEGGVLVPARLEYMPGGSKTGPRERNDKVVGVDWRARR